MIQPHTPEPPRPGFNVVGHVTGNLGLAVAARNTLRVLTLSERPFVAIDVDPGGGRGGHDSSYAEHMRIPPQAPYATNIFQLNPMEVTALAQEQPAWLDLVGRFNVCVPFWELPRLPVKMGWIPLLETVDVVLAPTRFVLDAVRASAPSATVWHYPQAVFLPDGIVPDRSAFGLPDQDVLFYMSLDITSDVTRKNPTAVLQAFARAFDERSSVRLVVKLNNSGAFSWAGAAAQGIQRLLSSHPNIIVIDRTMDYREVLCLSASCDVYVSMHRSEGLGLNLLEAMSLGKPVIATGWSGNMDFMTPENSCLVGYKLIPVVAEHASYQRAVIGPDQTWAEPDIDEAAKWMRLLAAQPDLRRQIGARAAADMAKARDRFTQGEIFDRLAAASVKTLVSSSRRDRKHRWVSLRRRSFPLHLKRVGGRILRRLGLRR